MCWETVSYRNCGACAKCLRTMATLELLGVLDTYPTFDRATFSLRGLTRAFAKADQTDIGLQQEVRAFAESLGRRDVVSAVDASMRQRRLRDLASRLLLRPTRSRILRRTQDLAWSLVRRLAHMR